jgi:hypothetical protein
LLCEDAIFFGLRIAKIVRAIPNRKVLRRIGFYDGSKSASEFADKAIVLIMRILCVGK